MNRNAILTLVTSFAYFIAFISFVPRTTAQAPSAADHLFADGRKAMASGDYANACRLFAASQGLDPAIGTLLNLGECTVKQSKYLEARAYYKEAETLAVTQNDTERAVYAKQRYDALAVHIGLLSVSVDPSVANPLVFIDGKTVDIDTLAQSPIELERGVHNVILRSGSDVIAAQEVTIDATLVAVSLEPKATTPTALMLDKPIGGTKPIPGKRSKTGLFIAIGGATVFAGGVGLAFSAKSKYDEARKKYDRGMETPTILGDISDARKTGDIATIISITGIAAFTTGAVIYLVSGKQAGNTEVSVVPTNGGAAAFFTGNW